MQIKMVEFKGVDALLILKVGGHELHISYDNGYKFDHECLFITEHLKDGNLLALAEVDYSTLKKESRNEPRH